METYSRFTDEQLAGLLRSGDKYAYTEIYDRYKVPLFSFTYRRLEDVAESEDVVAELFLSLWDKHANFNLTGSLASYLFTATKNRVIKVITHKKVENRYIDSFREYLEVGIDNTDHLVRNKELTTIIDTEVALLPIKMRQVFQLSRQTNLSRKEIAAELGLSEETVKSHMHHALKSLKARLGANFYMIFF
jgi:RNA polymerase sigma-70 factor (family 1)